jgi:hypothetical protein
MVHTKEVKKIAVFLGDFFWSSIPYDGIDLLNSLKSQGLHVDLLMFSKDIRLNKKFKGDEKYKFCVDTFSKNESLVILKDWEDFYKASKDYLLILSSVHIAPMTRYPKDIKKKLKCPIACWDIGGADILTNAIHFSTFYFAKGKNWKVWLSAVGIDEKNIYVTGSPHYDYYQKVCDPKDFDKKYQLDNKKKILVCPSNPGSHKIQFSENLNVLKELVEESKKRDAKVLIKTYPNDYLFYDSDEKYTGVYRRISSDLPQYESLKRMFPELEVVESQDHFEAVSHCDAMFNMSGSHISWETHFTKNQCYTSNHSNKSYYKSVNYLKNVIYPDDIYNKEIVSIQDIFNFKDVIKEENDYIERSNSIQKIVEIVKDLLYNAKI